MIMRISFIYSIILLLVFSFTACETDEDYIFEEVKIVENKSRLLDQLNNNPWNNCTIIERFVVEGFSLYMKQSSSGSVQGAACYGDYLFQFQHGLQNIYIYNLKTKEFVRKLEYDLQSSYHCNNANFSTQFYSSEDMFPLLYVSQQNNKVHQTLVYRLIGDSINSINLDLVQTIIGPTPTDENHMYYQDCIIDDNNGYFYLYAHHKREEQDSFHVVRYKLPAVSEDVVKLTDNDVCGSIYYDNKFCSPQGAVYHNSLLFFVKGVPAWKEHVYLDIVDFDKKEVCSINLTEKGFKKEPEGICFYGDDLFCATNSGGIFNLHYICNSY